MLIWRYLLVPLVMAVLVGMTVGPLLGYLLSVTAGFIHRSRLLPRADPVVVSCALAVFTVALVFGFRRAWVCRPRSEGNGF